MYNTNELEHLVAVHIANGHILKAKKKEKLHVKCQGKKMTEALIVPDIKHNLLSVSKLTSRGHKVIMEKNNTLISGKNFDIVCENINGCYILRLDEFIAENCSIMTENNDLCHRRLGHAGKDVLKQLGLPIPNSKCITCLQSKATRFPLKHT